MINDSPQLASWDFWIINSTSTIPQKRALPMPSKASSRSASLKKSQRLVLQCGDVCWKGGGVLFKDQKKSYANCKLEISCDDFAKTFSWLIAWINIQRDKCCRWVKPFPWALPWVRIQENNLSGGHGHQRFLPIQACSFLIFLWVLCSWTL